MQTDLHKAIDFNKIDSQRRVEFDEMSVHLEFRFIFGA